VTKEDEEFVEVRLRFAGDGNEEIRRVAGESFIHLYGRPALVVAERF
jgi:hypothetical protein